MTELATVAVAGATQDMIEHVIVPAVKAKMCRFILFSTEALSCDSQEIECRQSSTPESVVSDTVQAIVNKEATVLMKGSIHTSAILREVLKKENGLRKEKVLSQVSVITLDDTGRQLILTDPALNIQPDANQKIAITKNAIDVAHKLGIKHPKAAILSSVEEINPKMPSSVDAAEVANYFETNPLEAIVEGPISMDIATDQSAATIKNYQGKINGDADILVVPGIDAGNLLYKAFTHFIPATVSGAIVGAAVPVALSSRSDNAATKLASLKLAIQSR